ncbi:MBL fold metallo-hydrolase [Streptomyces sp. NPDC094038]|uniref:MBL fold metallo-hydrolase n=1 Tax=Streptomyces sp. NPDC094038 TaxID=3366055 RepID=UPI0037F78968
MVDCGRGAVSQYLRAGLSMPSLTGIFLTHLHSDHIADYFAFPLLSAGAAGAAGFTTPVNVYGPGPAGIDSTVAVAPGPIPGTAEMTELAARAYAASPTFFMKEHTGADPIEATPTGSSHRQASREGVSDTPGRGDPVT